jgi:Arc/MetJ family transcription regulator
MRTNIVIDDQLMKKALEISGLSTKKDVVEQGLRLLVRQGEQQSIRALRGKVHWDGDLDGLRGGE